ncbi:MAG TPA: VOC family protein [Vicinamibacterales bacterium]|nr:VOC family protein [Vicinamibacterales bacterium]
MRFTGIRGRMAAAGAVWGLTGLLLSGQAPSGPKQGLVIDTGALTPFVENMDRSLAFYHDVFDMEVPPLPATGMRPYNNPNPRLFAFFDIPGAKERHQSARVLGIRTGIEPMEIQQVPVKTVALRIQDPGNVTLVLKVRDLDATLARVKKAGYPVMSAGGAPVRLDDGTRAVIVRDVDNRFLELRQPPSIPASAPAHNIVDITAMVTVGDLPRTTQVYRDVFGFTVEGEKTAFSPDRPTRALTGLGQAEFRWARAKARDSQLWLEFVEYKGVDRTPLKMKIQDRGATRLQFRTQGIDAVVDAAKRAGLTIATVGGKATPIPPNFLGALVVDPSNFFVSLFESCDGCAPREAPPASTASAQAAPASTPPPATRPALLYKEDWREPPVTGERTDENQRIGFGVVANPNLELKVYGADAKVVRAARHEGRVDLWTGLTSSPTAVLLRDKRNYVDLTGLARLRWMVRTNAIHTLYPAVKLADGSLIVGNRAINTADEFYAVEVSFMGMRWYKLDPVKVIVGTEVEKPDLKRVDEVGLVTLAPGGGHGIAGSANFSGVELFASGVPR